MDDFGKLKELSENLQKYQQDFWVAGDREKPRFSAMFFPVSWISLAVLTGVIFIEPAYQSLRLVHAVFFFLIILFMITGRRFYSFFHAQKERQKEIIFLNEEIIQINQHHIEQMMQEVSREFDGEKRDFAEFLCCMSAFFGFMPLQGTGDSLNIADLPLVRRWRIPQGDALSTYVQAALDAPLMRSVPDSQRVGILAIMRKNIQILSGAGKDTSDVDDLNQTSFLIKRLVGDPSFYDRFSQLINRFVKDE